MSAQKIPAQLIGALSEVVSEAETHATLDALFLYSGAPGDPPLGSKMAKAQEWLRRVNIESKNPIQVLGQLIEKYMEADCTPSPYFPGNPNLERKEKIERALKRAEFQYVKGGQVIGALGLSSKSLHAIIIDRDLAAINLEFERAASNVESNPREAVSASCNILESIFKIYIEDEGLETPKKQDLQGLWAVVKKHLGFDPSILEDRDLQEILSGIFATVNGIGALRTHASAAHGSGRKVYKLEPRHARLAVHAAHTLSGFILESWDQRRKR